MGKRILSLGLTLLVSLNLFAAISISQKKFEAMAERREVAFIKVFRIEKEVYVFLNSEGERVSGIKTHPQYKFAYINEDVLRKDLENINKYLSLNKYEKFSVMFEDSKPAYYDNPTQSTDTSSTNSGNQIGAILLVVAGLFVYFIPSIAGRNKRNSGSILALNIFLGWTLVGWVVSLVWALAQDAPATKPTIITPPQDSTDQLIKLKKLLDDGALTQEEFEQQKKKILAAK